MISRSWMIGLGAVLSAGVGGGLAETASAGAQRAPRTSCSAAEYWSATDAQQAWMPVGVLGAPRAAGQTYTYYTNTIRGEVPASLTVGAQLGVPAGSSLSVHKLPAQVSAVTSATTRLVFSAHSSLENGSSKDPNPLHESARPVLFATGWRVRATLYRPNCSTGTTQTVRTRSIYLFQRSYVIGVGWVGIHTTPHPLYGHRWALETLAEQ